MSDFHPTVQLLATLAGLWLLSTLFAQHFQRAVLMFTRSPTAASRTYDLLLFPGVVLHELAHVALAIMLRVRVLRADLFRLRSKGDPRQGEVIVARADPLRMSLIGAAPLLIGVPVVLLLLRVVDVPPLGFSLDTLQALRPLVREPVRLLGVYVLWAIANAMFPSAADRAAWRIVGAVIILILIIATASGQQFEFPPALVQSLTQAALQLTGGLLPVVILDIVLVVTIVVMNELGRLMRRR